MSTDPTPKRDGAPLTAAPKSAEPTPPRPARSPQPAPAPAPRRQRGFWEQVRLGLLILTGVLLGIFIVTNYSDVEVNLLFWSPELNLAWALLGAALLGFIAGWLVPKLPTRRR